jgi:hypothetical protein
MTTYLYSNQKDKIMSNSLTQQQINLIKQTIAVYDNVFVSTISDQDVFDFVNDVANSKRISFSDAAYESYDDFDVAKMLGLDY